MKIAIYGYYLNADRIRFLPGIFGSLLSRGAELYLHSNCYASLKQASMDTSAFKGLFDDSLPEGIDYLITLGGDGTILRAVSLVYRQNIPIVGINLGRLGFLSTIGKDDVEKCFDVLFRSQMNFYKKMLLEVECSHPLVRDIALNEVVVSRKDTSSMISVEATVDGRYLNTYWADGLIVSTPTGSTGYSLSCGGPIVMPDSKNIVLTPIAPHNLNVRPVIFTDNVEVTLKVSGREAQYLLFIDSQFQALDQEVKVTVRRSPYSLRIGELPDNSFFDTLRGKLHWGNDNRN